MTARILIVDDEQAVRTMCVAILGQAGYETAVASDGQSALDMAQEQSFDLLLTDLRMPGMGGIELLERMLKSQPEMATMVMTGFGTMDSAIEALRLGVSEYILKPFRTKDLRDLVKRALERHQLRTENARLQALVPLFDLNRTLMRSADLETTLGQVVSIVQEQMQADRTSLMLLDGQGALVVRAALGLPEIEMIGTSTQTQSIADYVLEHQSALVLTGSLLEDSRFMGTARGAVHSAVSVPLTYRENPQGVLNVSRVSGRDPFTEGDRELVLVLAGQAAIAIENARLFTETQEAYARLAELDHLKGEFISVVSHELRAPLGSLLAFVELLDCEGESVQHEYLDQVVDSAHRLREIIGEITTFEELGHPDDIVQLSDVEIVGLMRECWAEFGQIVAKKRLRHQILNMEDEIHVQTDPAKCKAILGHLISNACKFTPQGGQVTTGVEVGENNVTLFVIDTGPGISPEQQVRIFEPFYQVEDALTREHGGLGLGLALAREMATALGATLTVESEIGEGATFRLDLLC